jgi:hypothetical protein
VDPRQRAGHPHPGYVIKRLEGAQDQKKEGKQLCIDIINEVKEILGVSGVHVMAYRQEEYVAEIVHESGVLKGRAPGNARPVPGRPASLPSGLEHPARQTSRPNQQQSDMVKTPH